MVTLTYRAGASHRQKQVSDYLQRLRVWAARRGLAFGYVWVIELTKAGVPHYHLVIWLPRGYRLPKGDVVGWWAHGMTQTARARNAVGYLVKYSTKANYCGHSIPKGSRLFGCGGLSAEDRRSKSWQLLPEYVRDAFDEGDDVKRAPGGGWVSASTGEWVEGVRLIYYDHYIYAVKEEV
jgi:hypothetical protein